MPPRAYQSRLENPGDKKSKADNISVISSNRTTSYALALGHSIHKSLSQNLGKQEVTQTGGTDDEEEEEQKM